VSKEKHHQQKKGPLAMSKRPKSREETPKEGSDNARSVTAPQQYATALHKVQEFLSVFPCKIRGACKLATHPPPLNIIYTFQILR
jgi:hypothetical protein